MSVFVKDPEPILYHGEVLYRNNIAVGDIRAGSYGHSLGGAVGLAMVEGEMEGGGTVVDKKYLDSGVWEVGIAGVRYPAVVSLRPLYDPGNRRIKGDEEATEAALCGQSVGGQSATQSAGNIPGLGHGMETGGSGGAREGKKCTTSTQM